MGKEMGENRSGAVPAISRTAGGFSHFDGKKPISNLLTKDIRVVVCAADFMPVSQKPLFGPVFAGID